LLDELPHFLFHPGRHDVISGAVKHLAFLALLAIPGTAFAACDARPVAELPLVESGGKLLVPVRIQGSDQQIALDTGAGVTVISTRTADELEILHDFDRHMDVGGVGGADSILYIGKVDRFDLGPLHFSHQNFPIVDLPLRTAGGAPVAGFLGADILHNFDVEIDIAGGRLVLWPASCDGAAPAWSDSGGKMAVELDGGYHVMVPMRIHGVNLTALLDTGAGGLALTTRAALRAGLSDDTLADDPELHGTGVNNRAWHGHFHRFDRITIADVNFFDVPADIVPSGSLAAYDGLGGADALLGEELLRQMRLLISYRSHSLYMKPLQQHSAG
jgi:predicted aspartyl protease